MPSFDSDPFSYLRARAMGKIASLNMGVGANVLRSAINNAVLTSAINGQSLTTARTS